MISAPGNKKVGYFSIVQQIAIDRRGVGIDGSNNIAICIHSGDREICIGKAGKSDLVEPAGVDHEMMLLRVAGNAIVANNNSIPAHVVDICARRARKHK